MQSVYSCDLLVAFGQPRCLNRIHTYPPPLTMRIIAKQKADVLIFACSVISTASSVKYKKAVLSYKTKYRLFIIFLPMLPPGDAAPQRWDSPSPGRPGHPPESVPYSKG